MLADARLRVTMAAPSGEVLLSEERPLGQLLPGAMRQEAVRYAFSGLFPESYTVVGTVLDGAGHELAAAETHLEVKNSLEQSLEGEVKVLSSELFSGDPQTRTDIVTNVGVLPIAGQEFRRLLVDVAGERELTSQPFVLNLDVGASETVTLGVGTRGLQPGPHACVLQARIGGEWKTLGYAYFEVLEPPLRIVSDLHRGDRGRLLVLIDQPGKCRGITYSHEAESALHAEESEAERVFLEALLKREGWSYTIVTKRDEFARELRSGGYSLHALLSSRVKLDEQVQKELRETVFRGEGLIVAGDHDQRNQILDDPLGIRFKGRETKATGIVLSPTDLHEGGSALFELDQDAARIERDDAEAAGSYLFDERYRTREYPAPSAASNDFHPSNVAQDRCPQHKDSCAVTMYAYGRGRSVYAGFDLLAEAAAGGEGSLFDDLLARALRYAHPESLDAIPGAVIPVQLTLTNQGIATTGDVQISLPQGAAIIDAASGTVNPDGTLAWPFSLAEGETKDFTFWMRLPDEAGTAEIKGLVRVGQGGEMTNYDTLNLEIPVEDAHGLDEALAESVPLCAEKSRQRRDSWACHALSHLRKAEDFLLDGEFSKALKEMVEATDELSRVSGPEAEQVRSAVDHAIRSTSGNL